MKRKPPDSRNALSALRLSLALSLATLIPLLLYGSAPSWWSNRGVLVEQGVADDYAPANQGQLKNIAKAAVAELDAKLSGGAGDAVHGLVNSWSAPNAQTNDFAPVNLGQLKNVAKPFFDRLISTGLATEYPWTDSSNATDDFAVANIGQVKKMFSFDLPVDPLYDGDQNGLPDAWELQYFGSTGVDPNADPDGDEISNLYEYLNHTDPTDFFDGTLTGLAITGGGDQRGDPGTLLPVPVSVRVSSVNFAGVNNAPVTVMIAQGGARLVAINADPNLSSDSLTLRANAYDNDGYPVAQFYILLPSGPDVSVIRASTHGGSQSVSASTTAVAVDSSLGVPTDLSVTITSTSTAQLTWTVTNPLPTTLQASVDGGKTWVTLGTVTAGLTSATVTGLTPGRQTKFRVFSGGTPSETNNTSFGLPDPSSGSPPPPPSGGGGASDSADAVPLAAPVVEVDQAEFDYGHTGGYLGMRNSGTLYKNKEIVETTHIVKSDDSEEYTGSTTQTFAWIPGHESFGRGDREVTNTSVTGAYGGALFVPYQTVIWTDSVLRLESTGLLPQGSTASKTITLSNPFTNADAEAAGAAADLQFYGEFYEPGANDSYHAYLRHGHGNYDILLAKYRFRVNADPNVVVLWDVRFTPENGGPVQHDFQSWQGDGSTYSPGHLLDPRLLNGGKNGSYKIVVISAELMVDGNRDGEMSFDDPAVHDADQTSEEKPYRFWVNDDADGNLVGEEIEGGSPDYADSYLKSMRDLEDFTRLWITFKGITEPAKSGAITVQLEWKAMDGGSNWPSDAGTPAINVFRAVETDGGNKYLSDEATAKSQVSYGNTPTEYSISLGRVGRGQPLTLPASFFATLSESQPNKFLLFEGAGEGRGQLVLTLQKDGQKIGEYPPLYLDLKDVRRMYERGKITLDASEIPDPWNNDNPPPLTWVWDPWNWPPDIDPNAQDKTIAYVHGWRMTYGEYLLWADATFKRLWHSGYKGRFYSFRWPTYHGDNNGPNPVDIFKPGGTTYNPSEYRAWLSGPALANFVNGLPNANARYLIAHSMGNVASGSALRNNMQVTRYAMCNSAMAAMAYDGALQPNDPSFETPDTDVDPDTRQSFGLANKFNPAGTQIINFSLPQDYALGVWALNNEFFKPQRIDLPAGKFYEYRSSAPAGSKLMLGEQGGEPIRDLRAVTSVPEAMGYVTKSRTRAAGVREDTGGSVVSFVHMGADGFEFGDEHSAEWVYSLQATFPFWKEILKKFDIDVTNR
jgi:hypothetical protein